MVGERSKGIPICACLCMIALSGCTMRYANLAVASTRPNAINVEGYEVAQENVVGSDSFHILFVIPLGTVKLERAIEDALAKSGGDILINVNVDITQFYIPPVYGYTEMTVHGDALKRKTTAERK